MRGKAEEEGREETGDGTVDGVIREGFLVVVTTGEGPETSISGRGHRQYRHPEVQCWKEPRDLGNSRGDIRAEAPRRRGCWAGPTGRRTLWELGFSSPFRCNESSLSGGAGRGGRGEGGLAMLPTPGPWEEHGSL